MDCCAVCVTTGYAIKPMYEILRISHKTAIYRDTLHVQLADEPCEAFFFSYGVAVFWGIDKERALELLQSAFLRFQDQPVLEVETDTFIYSYGDASKIIEDEITLPNNEILTKLAISHGIAQSVKLGSLELSIQRTFNSAKHIPQDLAHKGKITLSRKEIRKKMGELFIERTSINLHMDVLDTPEFFWDFPELEPLYMMAASYLDVRTRVDILNQRLDVIHDLFEMLGSELNHSHSSRLEWTIICLIVIEVLVALMSDVFKIL